MSLTPFQIRAMAQDEVEACRLDYLRFLGEIGWRHDEVLVGTTRKDDLEPIDLTPLGLRLSVSPIGGLGVFAVGSIEAGQVIGPARTKGKRSQIGRYLNHSPRPNATFRALPCGDIEAHALRRIDHEEITVDYRTALAMPGTRQPKKRTT